MPGGGGCSPFSFSLFCSRSLFFSIFLANETGRWISAAVAKLTLTARRGFPGRNFNGDKCPPAFRVSGRHGVTGSAENRETRRDLSALLGLPGIHKRSGDLHVRVSIVGRCVRAEICICVCRELSHPYLSSLPCLHFVVKIARRQIICLHVLLCHFSAFLYLVSFYFLLFKA